MIKVYNCLDVIWQLGALKTVNRPLFSQCNGGAVEREGGRKLFILLKTHLE